MPIFKLPSQSFRWLFAELTTVVLGILIAFQVEEWRMTRSEENLMRSNLEEILVDLVDDVESLEPYIEANHNQSSAARALLENFTESEARDEAFIRDNYLLLRRTRLWGPNRAAYSSFLQSAGFRLIDNQDLRSELYEYYEYLEYLERTMEIHTASRAKVIELAQQDIYLFPNYDDQTTRLVRIIEPVEDMPRDPMFVAVLGEFGGSLLAFGSRLETTLNSNKELQNKLKLFLD